MAVDEVTAGADHHGVVIAALILPDLFLWVQRPQQVQSRGLTKSATDAIETAAKRVDTKRQQLLL